MKFKVISYIYDNMQGDHHIKPALDSEKSGLMNIGNCNKHVNIFETYNEAKEFFDRQHTITQCR